MAITDWPIEERPREKLLNRGAHALSDAELLAIFLRTGVKGKSAVDLARELLAYFGGLRPLLEASQQDFCQAQGLGNAKFSQLQAVLEMSRRHLAAALEHKTSLTSTTAVKQFVSAQLRHRQNEIFALILLNTQNQLIKFVELFNGTIDSASVYPREVVKTALSHNAAAVILAHNHPSGIAEPSEPDKAITKRLQQALQLVDIRTLDHLVVGDTETVSFAERGWI
ncbi:DNA repair protein RadC [Saccharophagus degradans]|uniref:RadC family protein n=1 Tax=Saccharophagus degradans TaxID=86304 RepID=UPI002477FBD0|nr:DNA repair protein RadC [Saccharophagus degradans]WGO98883.1 DNA repair protein RadC [Saccharophagus degradans]